MGMHCIEVIRELVGRESHVLTVYSQSKERDWHIWDVAEWQSLGSSSACTVPVLPVWPPGLCRQTDSPAQGIEFLFSSDTEDVVYYYYVHVCVW